MKYLLIMLTTFLSACSVTPKTEIPYNTYATMQHHLIFMEKCYHQNLLKDDDVSTFRGVINYTLSTYDYIDPTFESKMKEEWDLKYSKSTPENNTCYQAKISASKAYDNAMSHIAYKANQNLIAQKREEEESREFWSGVAMALKGLSSNLSNLSNLSNQPPNTMTSYGVNSSSAGEIGTSIYNESECKGRIVNGQCYGAVIPTTPAPLREKCYGKVILGDCKGVQH